MWNTSRVSKKLEHQDNGQIGLQWTPRNVLGLALYMKWSTLNRAGATRGPHLTSEQHTQFFFFFNTLITATRVSSPKAKCPLQPDENPVSLTKTTPWLKKTKYATTYKICMLISALNSDVSTLVPTLSAVFCSLACPMHVSHGLHHEMHTHALTHTSSKTHSHQQMNPTRTALVTRWVYTHASRRTHIVKSTLYSEMKESPGLSRLSAPPLPKARGKKKGGTKKNPPPQRRSPLFMRYYHSYRTKPWKWPSHRKGTEKIERECTTVLKNRKEKIK